VFCVRLKSKRKHKALASNEFKEGRRPIANAFPTSKKGLIFGQMKAVLAVEEINLTPLSRGMACGMNFE